MAGCGAAGSTRSIVLSPEAALTARLCCLVSDGVPARKKTQEGLRSRTACVKDRYAPYGVIADAIAADMKKGDL